MLRFTIVISLLICGCQSAPEAEDSTGDVAIEKPLSQSKVESNPPGTISDPETSAPKNKTSPTKDAKATNGSRQATKSTQKQARKKPVIAFADPSFDFGEIFHAEKVTHQFEFVNEGNRELEIKSAKASCGCTTPSYPFLPIAPGESGFIGVTYNSVGKQGFQRANIRVATNDPDRPEVVLKLKGRVKVKPKDEYDAEQAAKKKNSSG